MKFCKWSIEVTIEEKQNIKSISLLLKIKLNLKRHQIKLIILIIIRIINDEKKPKYVKSK